MIAAIGGFSVVIAEPAGAQDRRSNQACEGPEFSNGRHEALPGQRVQILIDRIGWIFQTRPNLTHGNAKEGRFKPNLRLQKNIWMQSLQAMRSESRLRKVTQGLDHNGIAMPDNSGRENMPVIRIGKPK